jgi:hypothetical protein
MMVPVRSREPPPSSDTVLPALFRFAWRFSVLLVPTLATVGVLQVPWFCNVSLPPFWAPSVPLLVQEEVLTTRP